MKSQNKQKNRGILKVCLVFAIVIIVFAAAGICIHEYFKTNVYQSESEFREYAQEQLNKNQVFQSKGTEKTDFEYNSPISYAINYLTISDDTIKNFHDNKVNKIKNTFIKKKKSEEKKRAEKNKDNKRYHAPEAALILNTSVYDMGNGAVSLTIKRSENAESGRDMHTTATYADTYFISSKTGNELTSDQIMRSDYRTKCSQIITDYLEKKYKNGELSENWMDYLTPEENNFNEFAVGETDFVFYFDKGTVLKDSNQYTEVRVSRLMLETYIRSSIKERYVNPDKPMVALTYDDGPGGKSEDRILDCLEKNGAVATFFYVGNRVSAGSDKIKRAVKIGCEIGNHSWSHPQLTLLDTKDAKREIRKTNRAIKKACGQYPTVFRPCYGDYNKKTCKIADMPVILWSVDTLDWKTKNAKKIFKSIKSVKKLDGKIILMHSIHDETAAATKKIIPWLKKHGYQTVTVSELIKYKKGSEAKKGKVYY